MTRLQQTRELYDRATAELYRQREEGGIVPEEQGSREWLMGVRWKPVTPEARVVLGWWQQRKAELDAAQKYAGEAQMVPSDLTGAATQKGAGKP